MRNVTIALDEQLIDEGRRYAATQGTTLNGLIRDLLTRTVQKSRSGGLNEAFRLADELQLKSHSKWTREDLHDR